jgi:hypothetical protein
MRGVRPTKTIKGAQRCAEKMAYHWIKTQIRFCSSMHSCSGRLLSLPLKSKRSGMRSMRMCLSSTNFPMKLMRCAHSRFPLMCSGKLWIRTQDERAWRRFYILPHATAEIELNTAKNYRNTHFDEEKWRRAPFRIDIPLPTKKRDEAG